MCVCAHVSACIMYTDNIFFCVCVYKWQDLDCRENFLVSFKVTALALRGSITDLDSYFLGPGTTPSTDRHTAWSS